LQLRGALLERAHVAVDFVGCLGGRQHAKVVRRGDHRGAELAHLRVDLWSELQLIREHLGRHPRVVVGPEQLAHSRRINVQLALAIRHAHGLDKLRTGGRTHLAQ
jgi:hypothetical protein